jgi:hypothetical protein
MKNQDSGVVGGGASINQLKNTRVDVRKRNLDQTKPLTIFKNKEDLKALMYIIYFFLIALLVVGRTMRSCTMRGSG